MYNVHCLIVVCATIFRHLTIVALINYHFVNILSPAKHFAEKKVVSDACSVLVVCKNLWQDQLHWTRRVELSTSFYDANRSHLMLNFTEALHTDQV